MLTANYGDTKRRSNPSVSHLGRSGTGNIGGVKSIVFPPAKDLGHVIICGHVFTYAEKQPFVFSGVSVLGALEYDKQTDTLKCHECGEWWSVLSRHIAKHGLTSRQYKAKHGLRVKACLYSPGQKAKAVERFRSRPAMKPFVKGHANANPGNYPTQKGAVQTEARNAKGRCKAQILFKLQTLAARLKRTPTAHELDSNGLVRHELKRVFEVETVAEVLAMVGLKPNPTQVHVGKWAARMPWPKEYFETIPKMGSSLG